MSRVMAKTREVVSGIKARPRFTVMTVAAVALLLWVFLSSSQVSNRADRALNVVESQQVLIDKLAVALDEARAQGAAVPAPEVIAAETPGAEVSPAVGATGERGEAGAPGAPGAAGEPGIGLPGGQGEKGDTGTSGATGDPGTTGAQGTPGIGVAGANGADGVSGPAGPQGDPGGSGPAGADGQPGTPGANGADGAPGSPGATGPAGPPPSSFTFTIGLATYECTPTSPGATTYTCAIVP